MSYRLDRPESGWSTIKAARAFLSRKGAPKFFMASARANTVVHERLTIALDFAPDAKLSPTTNPATIHPDGYLIADAYIARDGLLDYSDGKSSWKEYRPRSVLEAAAASWYLTPVTDEHPKDGVVTADTWRELAHGLVVSPPTIEEIDGVGYLRARIVVGDAALVEKIRKGQHEVSIGYLVGRQMTDEAATGYRKLQTVLLGNHVASVPRGRAGPAVRVFMGDSAKVETDNDAEAPATTMVKVKGPDGTEHEVPTWIAAALTELLEMRAKQAAVPAPPAAPAAPAPMPPAAEAATPAPAAVKPEEIKKDSADGDAAIQRRIQRRVKLERAADRAAVKVDSTQDDVAVARAVLAKVSPTVATDGKTIEQLEAMIEMLDVRGGSNPPAPRPAPVTRPPASIITDTALDSMKHFLGG